MKASTRPSGRKILYILVIGLVCILAVEGLARIATRGPRWLNPYYVEISSDFAGLDALIADTQNTHPAPKYYDEFLYLKRIPGSARTELVSYWSFTKGRYKNLPAMSISSMPLTSWMVERSQISMTWGTSARRCQPLSARR